MDPTILANTRLDAGETIFFTRELEKIDAQTYDIKFPLLKGKSLVPKVSDISDTDNEYTYRQFRTSGKAKIISSTSDDLPTVNVAGQEFTSRIKPIGDSYCYDIFDIKAANKHGRPLDALLARAARQAIEELIDSLIAFGSTADNMLGFVNNAAVNAVAFVPVDKAASVANTWLSSGAPNATGPEMVADVNNFVAQRWTALKEAEGLGGQLTVVLPAAEYAYLASTPMGDNADKTALSFLLSNNPFLADIVPWHKLTGAGAGSANRMICYLKDPMVLGSLIGQEYTPLAPQQEGLRFKIPVIARVGGTVIRYPVAMAYGDGI